MKKIQYYGIFLLEFFLLNACEDEMDVYHESVNRLNFVYSNADTVISRTFVYDAEEKVFDTVWLEIETMGYIKDQERKFKLEQIPGNEENRAVAGVHFISFDDPAVAHWYVIPAGKNKAKFPIILKRDISLKTREFSLNLKIGQNENFEPGYPDLQNKFIRISDILVKPEYWNDKAVYYFAGKYGKVKHLFMIEATKDMGVKINDDFFYSLVEGSVDSGLTDYWFYFFTRKLLEENTRREQEKLGPLREAPEPGETEGALVKFTQYEH